MQLAALFLVLALQAGAVEKPCPESPVRKKSPSSQVNATSKPCGEIDLTAAQPSTNYSQPVQKKASSQLWLNALKTSDSIARSYSIIRWVGKKDGSDHLEYIFPSHYFW